MRKLTPIALTLMLALTFAACDNILAASNTTGDTMQSGNVTPGNITTAGNGTYKGETETTPTHTITNKLGNDEGFIVNGRYAALQGDWLFYREVSDDYKIYKIHTDGTDRQKITNDSSIIINVVGDWLYYLNKSDGSQLHKIRIDGTGEQKV